MNLLRKDMEEQAFLLEIQRLSFELDKLIDKYNMRERAMSVMVTGIIDENELGESRLRAIYSYSLDSRDELDAIMGFIDNTWDEFYGEDNGGPDIDDLLDGLGIELED